MNDLVNKHVIYKNCIIQVQDYTILYDEKIVGGGSGIVLLKNVEFKNMISNSEFQQLFQVC
jgi:hypothetical protein